MRLIDKAINFLFSRKIKNQINQEAKAIADQGIQKIKAQLGYGYTGNFALGGQSSGAKWPYGMAASGSGSGLVLNHYMLRLNARRAYHDTPQTKALVDRYADTVADIGLMLEPTPKFGILGIDPEKAEKWGTDVAERFDSWAKSKKQHRSGNLNFYQSHRLYQIFQHRDGDIFVRLYYSQDKNLLNPLQFEFIDPNQIRGDAFTTSFGPYLFDDGIERDAQGREKAYKVWTQNPKKPGFFDYVTIPAIGEKSKRIFMLHGFVPEYAGQKRGYSRLAHALQEFENITDFTTAQIKKAIIQSTLNMVVESDDENPAVNPFQGILTNKGAGPANNPIVAEMGSSATPSPEMQNVSFYDLPEATFDNPGSVGVFNLPGKQKLKPFNATAPAESFDKFVDAFTSYLSASTGMPLEVLLMKFNQNYSASRASLILFWRVAQIWREEMASDYLNPVYEMWLAGEIAAGRISAPGWSDPRLRAAWLNARWIGSPMPNIDPAKTAKADQIYVEMGAQTLERVSRNLNGSSGKANRAKLKREIPELTPAPWSKADIPDDNKDDEGDKNND